jgi:hypothetical protein
MQAMRPLEDIHPGDPLQMKLSRDQSNILLIVASRASVMSAASAEPAETIR